MICKVYDSGQKRDRRYFLETIYSVRSVVGYISIGCTKNFESELAEFRFTESIPDQKNNF